MDNQLIAKHISQEQFQDDLQESNGFIVVKLISDFYLMFVGSLNNYYQDQLIHNNIIPLEKKAQYRKFITLIELAQKYVLPSITILHQFFNQSHIILRYIQLLKKVYNKPAMKQYIKLLLQSKSYDSLFKLINSSNVDLEDYIPIIQVIYQDDQHRSKLFQFIQQSKSLDPLMVQQLLQANFELGYDNLNLIKANLNRIHLFWDIIAESLNKQYKTNRTYALQSLDDIVQVVANQHQMHSKILQSYLLYKFDDLTSLFTLLQLIKNELTKQTFNQVLQILIENNQNYLLPSILKILFESPLTLDKQTLQTIFLIIDQQEPNKILEPLWLLGESILKLEDNYEFMSKILGLLTQTCKSQTKEIRQLALNYFTQLIHHIGCNFEFQAQSNLFLQFYIPLSQFIIQNSNDWKDTLEQFLFIHIKLIKTQIKLTNNANSDISSIIHQHLTISKQILLYQPYAPFDIVQLISQLFIQNPQTHLSNLLFKDCLIEMQKTFHYQTKSFLIAKTIQNQIASECLSMVEFVFKNDQLDCHDYFIEFYFDILQCPQHYNKMGYNPPIHKLIAPIVSINQLLLKKDIYSLYDKFLNDLSTLNTMNVQNDILMRQILIKISKFVEKHKLESKIAAFGRWLQILCNLRWSKEYNSWFYNLKNSQLSSQKEREVEDAIWILAYELIQNQNQTQLLFEDYPPGSVIRQIDKFMKPSHLKLLLQNEVASLRELEKEQNEEVGKILFKLSDSQYDFDIILNKEESFNFWFKYVEMLSNFDDLLVARTKSEIQEYLRRNENKQADKRDDDRLLQLGKYFRKIANKEIIVGMYRELSQLMVVNEDRECRQLFGDCLLIIFNNIN